MILTDSLALSHLEIKTGRRRQKTVGLESLGVGAVHGPGVQQGLHGRQIDEFIISRVLFGMLVQAKAVKVEPSVPMHSQAPDLMMQAAARSSICPFLPQPFHVPHYRRSWLRGWTENRADAIPCSCPLQAPNFWDL